MRCLYNFNAEKSEKYIVVLLSKYEFLEWKLPTIIIGNLEPFQLFKQHYLEARNDRILHDSEEVAEINEAWDCSDINVREEYEKLCSPLQGLYDISHIDCAKIRTTTEIIQRNHYKFSASQSETKRGDFSNKVLAKADY